MAENQNNKSKSRTKKKKKKMGLILLLEFLVLLVLVVFLYLWSRVGLIKHTEIATEEIEVNEITEETEQVLKGYTTLALFGVDNRSNGNYDTGNSDVIMVVSIDNDSKQVRLMSVYRDTSFDVDGDGTIRKCNYAYNHGGVQNAIAMMNRNMDLDIEDYVTVDFKALTDAVDALGGIELDITQEEINGKDGLSLNSYINEVAQVTGEKAVKVTEPGLQTLNGVQVTAYCRIRFTGAGDLDRAGRQRLVISKLVEKAKKSNPVELDRLITAVFPEIETSMDLKQIIGMATGMMDYELSSQAGFPFSMRSANLGGSIGSVDVPCTLKDNVEAMFYYLYGEKDHVCSDTVLDINESLINLSGFDEENATDYGYQTINELMVQWAEERGETIETESAEGTGETEDSAAEGNE